MKGDEVLAKEMDESISRTLKLGELDIYYDPVSDTLSLWNGSPAGYGEMVAKHLTADSNANGEIVGMTLENAAKLLRPYLFPEDSVAKSKGTAKRKS